MLSVEQNEEGSQAQFTGHKERKQMSARTHQEESVSDVLVCCATMPCHARVHDVRDGVHKLHDLLL